MSLSRLASSANSWLICSCKFSFERAICSHRLFILSTYMFGGAAILNSNIRIVRFVIEGADILERRLHLTNIFETLNNQCNPDLSAAIADNSRRFCPGGTCENSPTFQRWELSFETQQVPKGRLTVCKFQSSLRDLHPIVVKSPTLKRWAIVGHPCGMKEFRICIPALTAFRKSCSELYFDSRTVQCDAANPSRHSLHLGNNSHPPVSLF